MEEPQAQSGGDALHQIAVEVWTSFELDDEPPDLDVERWAVMLAAVDASKGVDYLCARGDGRSSGAEYWAALSADSKRSLELQGGIFDGVEADAFRARPFADDGVRIRLWDDRAKVAGAATPPLAHYLSIAERVATAR